MRPIRTSIAALALTLSACSSDTATAPETSAPHDLAQIFAEMRLPALADVGVVGPTATAALNLPSPTNCQYNGPALGYVCAPVTLDGLTLAQTYWLMDASGALMSTWDPSRVASVRARTGLTGTMTDGATVVTIDQRQDIVLSGLRTDTHVLDGTTSMTMRGVVSSRGVTQQVDMSMTSTLSNIVQRSGTSGTSAWPRSGTITQDVVVSAAGLSTSLRSTITFNGTSKADVVITIAGVTQRCVVDMTSSTPSCN